MSGKTFHFVEDYQYQGQVLTDYGDEIVSALDDVELEDDELEDLDEDYGVVNSKVGSTTATDTPQSKCNSVAAKRSAWAKTQKGTTDRHDKTGDKLMEEAGTENETGDERVDEEEDDVEMKVSDLVIVGAGIAGLYALWKILTSPEYKKKDFKNILMVEQADRIGGRLRTDIIPVPEDDMEFVACEEGGMRFCWIKPLPKNEPVTQVMPKLIELIEELDLLKELVPFDMVPKGLDSRRYWYSGTCFTGWYAKQNMAIWDEIFSLNPQERNKSPGAIYTEVYQKILKENYSKLIELVGSERDAKLVLGQKNMARIRLIQAETDYWYTFTKYFTWNDIAMYRYTMRSLLTIMGYSQGCIRMLDQASGFQCFTEGKGNAGVAIQMNLTHMAMTKAFFCFKTGFSTLVHKLEDNIKKKLGELDDWLLLNQSLVSIDLPPNKRLGDDYSVLNMIGPDTDNTVPIKDPRKPPKIKLKKWKIKAKRVILALPRKSITQINIMGIPKGPSELFPDLVNSVWDVDMTKINLYFSCPWWNEDDDNDRLYGPSSTNLPIAQVYPFYKQNTEHVDSRFKNLCALTIYCDVQNSGFWNDLQSLPGTFTSAFQSEEANKALIPASLEVVKEALRELKLLFNVQNIPYPVLTTYTCWGDSSGSQCNPVAIHQWKRGIDDREVRDGLVQPFEGMDVYVCNEAWSEFQGWVEGSLMSASRVIDRIFHPPNND